jgi:GTP-binding protein
MTPRTSTHDKPNSQNTRLFRDAAKTGNSWRVISARMIDSQPPELYQNDETLSEYAFLGRSNVGKSSLINALCHRHKLAYTSATPGKTRLVHRYEVTLKHDETGAKHAIILVDLPGYGYAKVSKSLLADWGKGLDTFLLKRKTLKGLLLLVDSRHGQKEIDANTRLWAAQFAQPLWIVGTKSDQVNQQTVSALRQAWKPNPVIVTSAKTKTGLATLLEALIETSGNDEKSITP